MLPVWKYHFLYSRIMKITFQKVHNEGLFVFHRWRFAVLGVYIIPKWFKEVGRIGCSWNRIWIQYDPNNIPGGIWNTWQHFSCVWGSSSWVGRHYNYTGKMISLGSINDLRKLVFCEARIKQTSGVLKERPIYHQQNINLLLTQFNFTSRIMATVLYKHMKYE